MTLTAEQQNIVKSLEEWYANPEEKAIRLQAPAGYGKTYLLAEFVNKFEPEEVTIIAPTHAALAVLMAKMKVEGLKFMTVAKALNSFPVISNMSTQTKFASFSSKVFEGLVIVDESSMLSEQEVKTLINCSEKVIFSGDKNQLAPVKKKSGLVVLETLQELNLTQMMRAGKTITDAGFKALNQTQYIPETSEDNAVVKHESYDLALDSFLKQVQKSSPGDCVWITRTNAEVHEINSLAHELITGSIELKPGQVIRLYATSKLGKNNTLAVVKTVTVSASGNYIISTEPEDGTEYLVEVALPEQYEKIKAKIEKLVGFFQSGNGNDGYEKELGFLRSIVAIDFPYAISTHKSQGSSIPFVYVNTLNIHGRKAFYVAYSRASEQLNVIAKVFKTEVIGTQWFNSKLNLCVKVEDIFCAADVQAEIVKLLGKELAPSISHVACCLNPSHASKSAKGWKLI